MDRWQAMRVIGRLDEAAGAEKAVSDHATEMAGSVGRMR